MPGVPNAFEACVFTFGICQAGGAGKVLAEWVTEGETEWDMWSCDPRRFTAFSDQDYCVAKGMEVYGHEYAIHFPHHAWPAGRDKKLSADPRPHQGAGRAVRRLQWLGAGELVCAARATILRRKQRRPGRAAGRGSRAYARNAWRCAMPPAFSTCRVSRASG